ncbi:MAG: ribonuclease E/G, partial [Silicimonas sp.]|nr:ribonuclease E/G [Silicimonas sp.]
IRDLYNREIDEVFVEGERGYRIAKDFMKMIMPSHAKNVKKYEDAMPLFARYQVESYLGGMFNPTVQLKSGGYIVIGVTEALVAIDVNSGRATKEGSIEETALKTNLEAAEEVARQLRLRDLAGLIVIDFIDMDERKNNTAVEKRLKDKLKTDRARIQVGRISGFGLLEMSRQRLRPGMIEATTQPCPACHGTGLIRSDDSMALSILRQIEEEGVRRRSREVLIKCPVDIANYLMNQKRDHIAQIEARYGLSVRIEGDVHLVSPEFTLEKFKTASRKVAVVEAPVVSVDATLMDQIDEDEAETAEEAQASEAKQSEGKQGEGKQADAATDGEEEAKPKKKRRRRRRRKGKGDGEADGAEAKAEEANDAEAKGDEAKAEDSADAAAADAPVTEEAVREEPVTEEPATEAAAAPAEEAAPEGDPDAEDAPAAEAEAEVSEPAAAEAETSVPEATPEAPVAEAAPAETAEETAQEHPAEDPAAEPAPEEPPKPKKRGWWSIGGR